MTADNPSPPVSTVRVTAVEAGMVTDDGFFGVIRFLTDTHPHVVILPTEELQTLGLIGLALGDGPAEPAAEGERLRAQYLEVAHLRVGWTDKDAAMLLIEFEQGGRVGLRLRPDVARQLGALLHAGPPEEAHTTPG